MSPLPDDSCVGLPGRKKGTPAIVEHGRRHIQDLQTRIFWLRNASRPLILGQERVFILLPQQQGQALWYDLHWLANEKGALQRVSPRQQRLHGLQLAYYKVSSGSEDGVSKVGMLSVFILQNVGQLVCRAIPAI